MVIGQIVQLIFTKVITKLDDEKISVEENRLLALDSRGNIWLGEPCDGQFDDIEWTPIPTPNKDNINVFSLEKDPILLNESVEEKSKTQ